MKRVIITGKTYQLRESLRKDGFRWNPDKKQWYQDFKDGDTISHILESYKGSGIYTEVKSIDDSRKPERKYWIKEGWIFNLEAMHDKLACIGFDIEEGKLQFPLEIANRKIKNWDDLDKLIEEALNLESIAKSRKVTGKEFGRIKEMVNWRVEQRYMTCLASGMEESDAAGCFEDL